MRTYQDLLKVGDDERKRKDFVRALIQEHKTSPDYKIAADAYEYYCHRNVTINEFQKLLYRVDGTAVPDNFDANYKMASRYFYRFIIQEVQYLLGNGISFGDDATADKLGTEDKPIDRQVQSLAKKAVWGKQAFGFYDKDHVEIFSYLEFVPLYDEMNGALMAGVRFWQIDKSKPLRATLYEVDGFTKYTWGTEKDFDEPKRAYLRTKAVSEADGVEYYNERNYPSFPIVPMWANEEHQSLLVGLREQIDCVDLIKSGFANNVDEASLVYWTITNAGGMDDVDLQEFVDKIKRVHAYAVEDDNARAESHQLEVPYESREKLLDRLDADLYRDAMALDTRRIASGAVTATQILASYEDLNAKVDDFEYQVIDFLKGIMAVAGIDDEITFTRSQLVNRNELITALVQSAQYLSQEYVTSKILEVMGDGDKVEEVLKQIDGEDYDRFGGGNEPTLEE